MKRVYRFLLVWLAASTAALAQGNVQVLESVLFMSNSPEDQVRRLDFGFGTGYTDSVDFDKGEQILPPFFPPEGFFAFFAIPDKMGGADFGTKDVRGIPDSVKGGVNHFSQIFQVRLKRGFGQNVKISFQFPLMRGIDSVNFRATQAGADFNYTFTKMGEVAIPNSLINNLEMTVYYNYDRAASVPRSAGMDEVPGIGLAPNPSRGSRGIALHGALPAGSRAVVSDMYGSVVATCDLGEGGEVRQIELPELPAGAYMVRVIGRGGEVSGQGRLVVTR